MHSSYDNAVSLGPKKGLCIRVTPSSLSPNDLKKSSYIAKLLLKFKKKLVKNFSYKKSLNNLYDNINNIKNIKIDYLEIRNNKNLSKKFNSKNFKIFIAYYNRKIRIIDNY